MGEINRFFVLLVIGANLMLVCERTISADPLPQKKVDSNDAPTTLDPRSAWVRTGATKYGWDWLAQRYDADGNGLVMPGEFPSTAEVFGRLDCNWDGRLTAADFDWTQNGELCRQKETTFSLFKIVDSTSDGRITQEEWQAVFSRIAEDKGYLDSEDLEQLIYRTRAMKTQREQQFLARKQGPRLDGGTNVEKVPKPGDIAPDFELQSPDGKSTIRLSSFRNKKPVVLIFGCFSCGNYRTYSERLEALHQQWKDQVEFIRIYVREAHPVDDQPASPTNALAGILLKQPKTLDERCTIAIRFSNAMHIETPLVVDGIDNEVGRVYGGWPDRLYVVDREGRIAYRGGPGPFGFNPMEMEQALALMLLDQSAAASKSK